MIIPGDSYTLEIFHEDQNKWIPCEVNPHKDFLLAQSYSDFYPSGINRRIVSKLGDKVVGRAYREELRAPWRFENPEFLGL